MTKDAKHTHFIGIGGAGLSAIARVLLERGQKVSGSDRTNSELTDSLRDAGAQIFIGHSAENIAGADLVIRSSAVPENNMEVLAAQTSGIPIKKRVEYMEELLADKKTIAVAGSHGKTTTTAMISWMLSSLDENPGFIVGGMIANLGVNARAGLGKSFVIEADEYDHMFLGLNPSIAVVTNVEYDHPDFFAAPEDFTQAFRNFVARLIPDGVLVVGVDDVGANALGKEAAASGKRVLTFGFVHKADYSAQNLKSLPGSGYSFDVYHGTERQVHLSLHIPGKHNVLNALAALVVGDLLELSLTACAQALEDFRGVGRRFEIIGQAAGITIVDDYAHHPSEIRATIAAAREYFPESTLWVVWQPHTYSRTRELLSDYAASFQSADRVMITPVFAARETQPEDFSHQELHAAIKHPDVEFMAGLTETADFLLTRLTADDVLLVLSAGDAVKLSRQVLSELKMKEEQHA
ncbi:MAG: UDP-N-acetylmuramate--L-alanine ligase [Chloroflexi bacterium]|nr:UDP-N-acetylmuramate--L-alanine ligase [Chloroflexota bacterium]